jgi:hypothetical protein
MGCALCEVERQASERGRWLLPILTSKHLLARHRRVAHQNDLFYFVAPLHATVCSSVTEHQQYLHLLPPTFPPAILEQILSVLFKGLSHSRSPLVMSHSGSDSSSLLLQSLRK